MIDLRSDTSSPPSEKMREVIQGARIGDELYDSDPTTNELEAYCAEYFRKESALFVPSGIMANQIAIRVLTNPGDQIILDKKYHIFFYEAGSSVELGKISFYTLDTSGGIITSEDIEQIFENKHNSYLMPKISLLCLENTINTLGGKIYPYEEMERVYKTAKKYGIHVHLDGARLLNACVSTGVSPEDYAKCTDTLMLTFSKGLGAPFGAILVGPKKIIQQAKIYKKWFGGGMHQSGMMAAAALFGIKNNVCQLKQDHENARMLAKLLSDFEACALINRKIETNIVLLDIKDLSVTSDYFVDKAKKSGLLLYHWEKYRVRAVTHLGINKKDIEISAKKILDICRFCCKSFA